MAPVVFASLVPRFREERVDFRALSPAGLAIIALLVERGAVLEILSQPSVWATSYFLTEVCRDYDSPEALGLLARIGADIHTRRLDDWGRTLLQVAAGRGAIGAVSFLLDKGVPMNYTNLYEDRRVNGTPLHWAAANGRHQVVRLLLSRGALPDIEKMDLQGSTPLVCAARGLFYEDVNAYPLRDLDQEETIRLLVDAGADLTASSDPRDVNWWATVSNRNFFHDSPLGHVLSWGSADIVRYLAAKGSNIHQQRSYPKDRCFPYGAGGDKATPLHRGASDWNAAGVQALLDLGADPDATDEYGRQPLHWVAIGPCLLERDFERMSFTQSVLLAEPRTVASSARLAALELTLSQLIVHNASIGRQDVFSRRTPLHYAAYMKLVGAVTLLIKKGANLGLADNEGRTALHHLANPLYHSRTNEPVDGDVEDEHLSAILAGQIKGASVDIINDRDNTGSAALHIAARSASDAAVALLLGLGADPNLPDREGSTPLHLAARYPDWVRHRLGTYEPHEYAAWRRRAARIKALLLSAGADAGLRDAQGQGRTAAEVEEAADYELRRGRAEYLKYLANRPPMDYGRGRGFKRGRGGFSAPPGDGRVNLPSGAGAGHGRG